MNSGKPKKGVGNSKIFKNSVEQALNKCAEKYDSMNNITPASAGTTFGHNSRGDVNNSRKDQHKVLYKNQSTV